LKFSILSELKEKKVISEADNSAEANRRMIRTISPVTVLKSGGLTINPERSKEYESAYSVSNSITVNETN
jgi:hypothetical protein